MLAPRPLTPPDTSTEPGEVGDGGVERARRYGFARVTQAYAVTLLAAVLALPVVGAGLITSNNCTIRGYACGDRLAYGLIGAIVLAGVTQLMLALHFRLGWSFWIGCSSVMATATVNTGQPPVLVGMLLLAPGVAAWVSEPPDRRRGVLSHWAPRYAVLLALVLAGLAVGWLS
ncbi:MAG: hypothetical protein J2P23_12560 [Microlunatus sp.]|nr:hypothetical protein [Microlunatus sp.]